MAKIKLYIPHEFYKNIFEINYDLLKQRGIKALFFDLDNTLIDYNTEQLSLSTISFLSNLKKDFKIVIVSNNSKKRVSRALGGLFPFVSRAFKPLKGGFRKALKLVNVESSEIAVIGDQLMTDIRGSNSMGFYNILILPLMVSSDAWTTRVNRYFEQKAINKLKAKYPDIYKQRIEEYEKYRNSL